tara:strand:+ start:57 stop:269 length:213 start_codon:yes stop_codon:yes gene_type:complete
MKYLYILLLSASVEGYYKIKLDRDHKYTCFKQADIWIENNATHTWESQQGYYLNRSGKKELVFGAYCDNK